MKAAFIAKCGPAEAIRYGDLPDPVPQAGEVLVQVEAVAVNPVDTYLRSGAFPMALPFPFVIGRDLVGTVRGAGPRVRQFRAGDRVWSNCQGIHGRQGTFAELATVPEEQLYPLPARLDSVATVAVLHSALTAVIGLFDLVRLRAGDTIFINGGSGNVGTAVLQLARAGGARVAVTAGSAEKARWCADQGADLVIDYRRENVTEGLRAFAPGGVDLYWDASPQFDLDAALAVLACRGRVVVMAGLQHRCPFPVGPFYTRNATSASKVFRASGSTGLTRW